MIQDKIIIENAQSSLMSSTELTMGVFSEEVLLELDLASTLT